MFEGEENYKKDFNFIGYTYKLETEPPKNFVLEELGKVEKQKEKEKEKEK